MSLDLNKLQSLKEQFDADAQKEQDLQKQMELEVELKEQVVSDFVVNVMKTITSQIITKIENLPDDYLQTLIEESLDREKVSDPFIMLGFIIIAPTMGFQVTGFENACFSISEEPAEEILIIPYTYVPTWRKHYDMSIRMPFVVAHKKIVFPFGVKDTSEKLISKYINRYTKMLKSQGIRSWKNLDYGKTYYSYDLDAVCDAFEKRFSDFGLTRIDIRSNIYSSESGYTSHTGNDISISFKNPLT